MTLPRFVVVKSNHNRKFLRYIKDDGEENAPAGFLKFSEEEAGSHYAKYEVETAKNGGNKGLVHIRCCYNNKYWVSVTGTHRFDNEVLIVAGADEPEEDKSKPSCTLFEPVYVDPVDKDHDNNNDNNNNNNNNNKNNNNCDDIDSQVVQFRHVHLGCYATLHSSSDALVLYGGSTAADDPNNAESHDVCTVVNWESLVILPKHVVFKGDDGNYLTANMVDDKDMHNRGDEEDGPYLQFDGHDACDPIAANEIFRNPDGTLQIKNSFFGRYWRLAKDKWIWPDAFNPTTRVKNYKDTLYRAFKLYDKAIALMNVGNKKYCKRYTCGITDITGMCANVSNLSIYSHLHVEEPVKSRTIYNVSYRLAHARIYNYQNDTVIATGEAVNFTQQTTNVVLKLLYKKSNICSWNDISRVYSIKPKTNVEADGIPQITGGDNGAMKFEISGGEFKGAVQWGETETSETQVETVCMVGVPAMSVVKVRLLAAKASCDVPFSYSRRDTGNNDQVHVTDDLDDGFYSSINAFNFKYDIKQERM
ncbi:hypothetical protein ACFX1X_028302 [Malus domestica]